MNKKFFIINLNLKKVIKNEIFFKIVGRVLFISIMASFIYFISTQVSSTVWIWLIGILFIEYIFYKK